MDKNKYHWSAVVKALETWRAGLGGAGGGQTNAAAPAAVSAGGSVGGGQTNAAAPAAVSAGGAGGAMPSVTTIAERYTRDPWAVLVSTIISLRTKDAVTLAASQKLLEKANGPRELLALSEEQIGALIYPAGFYKTKAASLKKIACILLSDYEGKVPARMDALLALPGVGRKTANLVLIEAYDMDGICVDTHVHRISNRLGVVQTKTPNDTEFALRECLPQKYWKRINPLLVLYGQNLCKPVSPRCEICVIKEYCNDH